MLLFVSDSYLVWKFKIQNNGIQRDYFLISFRPFMPNTPKTLLTKHASQMCHLRCKKIILLLSPTMKPIERKDRTTSTLACGCNFGKTKCVGKYG